MKRPALLLLLLVVAAFSLGAWLQPRLDRAAGGREADNVFKILFGEGRRMFANHFAVKADVYLHSGFYPSIFDQAAEVKEGESAEPAESHVHTAECNHERDHEEDSTTPDGHKCDTTFMGEPRDWIEKFGRNFLVTEHTHLEGGKEREILPWLKLSAELDPQRIETYTVAGYWLAERMNKPKDAEEFLRQGLRANPQSYEILFELGKIHDKHLKQPDRARNVWLLALRRWDLVEAAKEKPDNLGKERILVFLARLEMEQGNYMEAVRRFQEAKPYAPSPDALDERIREIWLKFTLPVPSP
jgi:tetratricopeptide (TPR) repeat protein